MRSEGPSQEEPFDLRFYLSLAGREGSTMKSKTLQRMVFVVSALAVAGAPMRGWADDQPDKKQDKQEGG